MSASIDPVGDATRGDDQVVVPFRRRVHNHDGLLTIDARPPRPIGSARGRWAFSLGERADGLPRGVWVHITDTDPDHWALVAPLPYVHRVLRQPDAPARFRTVYLLGTTPAADHAIDCTRGEVMSGRWAVRLDVALSADPPVVRAVARAILALGEQPSPEVRG
ncbi:MAG TPA: hypothetical protein VG674_31970 [Amycolatopsis sp.]|nr:hypothetical protein [Amycolatopsis sp.]